MLIIITDVTRFHQNVYTIKILILKIYIVYLLFMVIF